MNAVHSTACSAGVLLALIASPSCAPQDGVAGGSPTNPPPQVEVVTNTPSNPARAECLPSCKSRQALERVTPTPCVIRYRVVESGTDPARNGARFDSPAQDFTVICDGTSLQFQTPHSVMRGDDSKVWEWTTSQRNLTAHTPCATPHAESVAFLLLQAQRANWVIPKEAFESACTCAANAAPHATIEPAIAAGAAAPASAPTFDAEFDEHGWMHRLAFEPGISGVIRAWELLIPSVDKNAANPVQRRVRVEVTEWDADHSPLKVVRVVEEPIGDGGFRVIGGTTLTVLERRAFDPLTDAARLQWPKPSDGWYMSDPSRKLEYVYGESKFRVGDLEFRASEAIRTTPDLLDLRELMKSAAE